MFKHTRNVNSPSIMRLGKIEKIRIKVFGRKIHRKIFGLRWGWSNWGMVDKTQSRISESCQKDILIRRQGMTCMEKTRIELESKTTRQENDQDKNVIRILSIFCVTCLSLDKLVVNAVGVLIIRFIFRLLLYYAVVTRVWVLNSRIARLSRPYAFAFDT